MWPRTHVPDQSVPVTLPLLKTLACARCWLSIFAHGVRLPRASASLLHWPLGLLFSALKRERPLSKTWSYPPAWAPQRRTLWKQHLNLRQRTPVCKCRAQCETCWALGTVLRCCCGVGGSTGTLLLMESGSLFPKPITSFPGATKWINSVSARCLNFWLDYLHHGLIIWWDTGRWMVLLTDDHEWAKWCVHCIIIPILALNVQNSILIHRTFPPSLHLQQMNFHHWRLLSQ